MNLFFHQRRRFVVALLGAAAFLTGAAHAFVDEAYSLIMGEAESYVEGGVDGIIVENMHDFPCVHERDMGPEVAAFMTRVAREIKRRPGQLFQSAHTGVKCNAAIDVRHMQGRVIQLIDFHAVFSRCA